ncbi:MAG: diacylglycerol kinase family protein [Acidobacteriota bacterium]|nr:diacylglycerol kinase family protein [Acidobacteriota bacterium]
MGLQSLARYKKYYYVLFGCCDFFDIIEKMENVAVLFNPSSGRRKSSRHLCRVEHNLKKYSIYYKLFITQSEEHMKQLARDLAKENRIIVGVGGDTTMTLIATEILDLKSDSILGMIATGSANDIIRGIGCYNMEAQVRAVKTGRVKKMDVGQIEIDGLSNPITFLGSVSLGLGVTVNRYVEEVFTRHPLWSKYGLTTQTITGIFSIGKSFTKKDVPDSVMIKTDKFQNQVDFALIVFANVPSYASGLKVTPNASPFSGNLECCVINSISMFRSLDIGIQTKRGRHLKRDEVQMITDTNFEVIPEEKIDLQYDGKIIEGVRKFRVSVLPAALNVFVLPG